MANSYVWSINQLDSIPQVGDLTDYVVISHWICTGTDEAGNFGNEYAIAEFSVNPDKPDYTPYDQLTEAEIIQWTQDYLGPEQLADIYAKIDAKIEAQVNPPIITLPLPWVAQTS